MRIQQGLFSMIATAPDRRVARRPGANSAALGEDVLGVEQQVGTLAHQVSGAVHSARLLVGRRQEQEIALQRRAPPREFGDGQQVDDRDALGVEGTTTGDEVAAPDPGEGVHLPGVRVGGDHVEVGEEHERASFPGSRQPPPGRGSADLRVARRRLDQRRLEASLAQQADEVLGDRALVAGRVHGLEANGLGEDPRRAIPEGLDARCWIHLQHPEQHPRAATRRPERPLRESL